MLINKIKAVIDSLELNLKGKTVLTEAASGAYIVTPLIAALAGAKVYAFSRTTHYGTIENIFANTGKLIEEIQDIIPDITLIDTLTPDIIGQADIITNSGHLRPLNKEKLQYAKESAVIPLMYEAWEWRESDLDMHYIRKRGIRVGATNERHPKVDVFNYLGDMAIKQIFDAGLCPYGNKFILISNNEFGPYISKVLSKVCERLGVIDTTNNKNKYDLSQIEWISEFPEISIPTHFKDAEAIIFTAYPFDNLWIGDKTSLSIKKIKSLLNNPLILRFAGDIDTKALNNEGIKYFPKYVQSGHMGILPSDIGYDPILRLQAGGLKVSELLLKNKAHFKENILSVEIA
jgi:hypothetical protein